ncbi:MAG: B-box zinc finger protein [Acidobacteria bacterium]|nr:B-box zinc finger protein [Acidobacteriota bacterium]
MNCIHHPDRERSAFCQMCGRPLCHECTRRVGTSVYCEEDLAAKLGETPVTAVPPVSSYTDSAFDANDPKPGMAALLGFIPGVGAMYNGQFAKGLIHIAVFAVLVSLADGNGVFGIFVAGWYFYMIIEAYQTAKARRNGTPLPNAFGLNDLGERLSNRMSNAAPYTPPPTAGAQTPPEYVYTPPQTAANPYDYTAAPPIPPVPPMPPVPPVSCYGSSCIPAGAVWMIVLGIFFLLGTSHRFPLFRGAIFWPLVLIGCGIYQFVRRARFGTMLDDGSPVYRLHLLHAGRGAFWMVLVGILLFLHTTHILSFHDSWPFFLIFAGVWMFLERSVSQRMAAQAYVPSPPGATAASGPIVTPPPSPGTAIVPSTYEDRTEEGR